MPIDYRRDIALIVIAACITLPAFAESPVVAVESIRQNPDYRNAVESVSQQYESALRTHCAKVDLSWKSAKVHVALPPTLDAQDHIQSAVWVETVPGEACGRHRQYTAVAVFRDGQSSILPSYPGESESNPMLQHDTLLYIGTALAAAVGVPASCHIDILETQLPNGRPKAKTPWTERWLTDACGKEYWVKVNYIPDATGTTIDVSPKDVALAK